MYIIYLSITKKLCPFPSLICFPFSPSLSPSSYVFSLPPPSFKSAHAIIREHYFAAYTVVFPSGYFSPTTLFSFIHSFLPSSVSILSSSAFSLCILAGPPSLIRSLSTEPHVSESIRAESRRGRSFTEVNIKLHQAPRRKRGRERRGEWEPSVPNPPHRSGGDEGNILF